MIEQSPTLWFALGLVAVVLLLVAGMLFLLWPKAARIRDARPGVIEVTGVPKRDRPASAFPDHSQTQTSRGTVPKSPRRVSVLPGERLVSR